MTEPWWISIIKAVVIVNLVMLTFAYLTWTERKVLGRLQLRARIAGDLRTGVVRIAHEHAGDLRGTVEVTP